MDRRKALAGIAALAGTAAISLPSVAQAVYPNKPIRIFVGVAPGGAADAMARLFAQRVAALTFAPMSDASGSVKRWSNRASGDR